MVEKTSDRIATGIFRVLIGAMGVGFLYLYGSSIALDLTDLSLDDIDFFVAAAFFLTLTLGYAFGGSNFAAKLLKLFDVNVDAEERRTESKKKIAELENTIRRLEEENESLKNAAKKSEKVGSENESKNQ